MLKNVRKLERPRKGQTIYCNCQKSGCFPCQNTGVIVADTEDGMLQLCKHCQSEYKDRPAPMRRSRLDYTDSATANDMRFGSDSDSWGDF